ncbi:uncharacterized protein QC763_0038150 [Podospora pseudopauciseta]|uniref:Uncharacterized protein n=1 Tax=Podospora pseudopauciseta TaxID=2093780 RepID=A0ABR0HPF4_9PEZI|nr:hypothetical protein QC763_0038150 [Podospora pseudopauciseta]
MRVPEHHSRVLLISLRSAEFAGFVYRLVPLLQRQHGGVRFET